MRIEKSNNFRHLFPVTRRRVYSAKLIGMLYCIEALSITVGGRRGPKVCWTLEPVQCLSAVATIYRLRDPSLIERAINRKLFRSPNHAQEGRDSRNIGELTIVS